MEKLTDGLPGKALGLLADLLLKLKAGKILVSELELFLKRKNPFEKTGDILGSWREFYRKNFGVELGDVKIPEKIPSWAEFGRLIVVAEGLTMNQVYDACRKRFPCWRYSDDLNKSVPTSERDPKNGAYAIWVRDVVEADKVHRNKSAKMIKEEGLTTETLLERMLHELVYFLETGEHLDIQNWTLCSGSRSSDGLVPYAYWRVRGFGVCWGTFEDRVERLRSREVIS